MIITYFKIFCQPFKIKQVRILGLKGATSLNYVSLATSKMTVADTAAVLVKSKLSPAQQKQILMDRQLTKEQAEETLAMAASTAANETAVLSYNKLAVAINGVKTSVKGFVGAIASHPIIAIASAAMIVYGIISTESQKAEEAIKQAASKAAESAKELKDTLSDLDDYKEKIDSVYEALSQDSISQEEATEKRQELLKIQDELIKKYGNEQKAIDYITKSIQGETDALTDLQEYVAKQWINDHQKDIYEASHYFNDRQRFELIPEREGMDKYGNTTWESSEMSSWIKEWAKNNNVKQELGTTWRSIFDPIYDEDKYIFEGTRDEVIAQYDKLYSDLEKYLEDNKDRLSDKEIENAQALKRAISGAKSYITGDENRDNYNETYQTAIDNAVKSTNLYSKYLKQLLESKNEFEAAFAEDNQSAMETAFRKEQSAFNELMSQNFIDVDDVKSEDIKKWFENFQKEFYQIVNDTPLIVDIRAELAEDTNSSTKTLQNIISQQGYKSTDINSIISKGLLGSLDYDKTKPFVPTTEQIVWDKLNEYVDTYNSVAKVTGTAEISINQYVDALKKLGIVQDEVNENGGTSFALSKDQTKELKSVHSDVDKLNKAYQNLFAGKLTTNDVAELVDLFPTLGEYVDWTDEKFGNLAEGIDKVIRERPADLIKQLEDVLNTQDLSDEAKKSIQSMIAALKQLKPELKDTKTLIEDIQKAIKGVSSSISTLIGFTKEISSDGALSLSSIDTIMTDDTYQSLRPYINDMEGMQTAITELVSQQKDAYEDLYNAEMYENDYEAYRAELDKKEAKGEAYLNNSVKEIQNEIKNIEQQYNVDLTNWDNLSETKKTILQNTNAELLSKQASLINTFKSYYDTDLTNYKNTTAAKAAILDNFRKSEAFAQASKIATEEGNLHMYQGTLYLDGKDAQNKINSVLAASGLTWQDYVQYLSNGTFTSKGNEALQKILDEIVKAYTITPPNWDKMTANIKGTGGSSSSSSSSKNYIDWIERRLKKFAQNTKEVFARVADYISFNNQNSQLRKAINAIRDEIAFNERAYDYYMTAANEVGLDPYWIDAVVNGASNVMRIDNDELQDKINRYKEYYDNAMNCKNAVDELRKTEKEYANQMLSNVEKYYSNRIDYANQDAEYYNSLDTDNLFMNKNFDAIRKSYNEQISYTQKEHDDLLNTLNSLVSNGSIKYQSDEWYEWWAKIQKCHVEVRNLKKSIHDLASEELQNLQGYWDNRIGVYDNTISYINTVGGDTTRKGSKNYKGLSSAYNSQIGYTNKQVSELQARLDKAVKAGDIEKYSDKWYEWTGIIEQGKEKVAELQANIHKLAVEQFEEIQKNYDNQLNLFEHTAKEYENKNKEIETRGLLANSKYYSKLQENEKNNILVLKNQAKDLEDSLNQAVKSGNIEVGSEEWYKMRDAILSVNEQIDESNIKLLEYAKTIREIGWEVFSFLQDRISQLTTESDFLIDLMSNSKLFDDSGNITAKGRATMGLHTQNYNVYMAQAEQYVAEIRRVNAQLAQDTRNTDIIKHREELLGLQQKSILAAEKEKKAIVDLTKQGFDEQLKSLKKLIETYTKSLDAAKSLYDYQKNINEKTSNISKLQKQLNAYQGDNSEETQARIQQLQTELKEAQEDLQQTEYEKLISDTKSLLDDLYDDYEETLNNRLDNVDALVSDMIGVVNNNSSDINTTIKSSAAEVGAILSEKITDIWTGKGAVNGNIVSNYYNGFDTKLTSVQATLNNISRYVSILAKAGENDVKTTTSNTAKKATTTKKPSTPQGTKSTVSTTKVSKPSGTTTGSTTSGKTNKSQTSTNTNKSNSNVNNKSGSTKKRTDKENYGVALAIINGNYGWGSGEVRKKNLTAKGFNYDTVQGIVNKLWKEGYVKTGAWKGKYYGISDLSPYAYKKFKSGGLVDYTGIAQVDGTPMKPESFLNADDTQNIADLRDTLRELAARPITMVNGMGALGMFGGTVTPNILDMSQKLQALSGSDMVQNLNVHNENHIEIDIDKVEDYNDFIAKMQKDRKFENIIQDMTFGRMNGGSSLAKYRH